MAPDRTIKTNAEGLAAARAAHTSEPWEPGSDPTTINGRTPGQPYTRVIAETTGYKGEREANRDRIVACVNACAGINPDAVPDMLAVLVSLDAIRPQCGGDEWVTLEIRRTQLTALANEMQVPIRTVSLTASRPSRRIRATGRPRRTRSNAHERHRTQARAPPIGAQAHPGQVQRGGVGVDP